ncbi:glycosyl hydrolase catalytic core-domain-containing protein [Mycena rebaudengoi]|nr:glycosyl hydrolase catalytic core-domain-containing protein [Mycena rebaudengoi]
MSKLINLIALSSLVALTIVSGPSPVAAVALEPIHGSNAARSHHASLAHRRRGTNRSRCKSRSAGPSSTKAAEKPAETPKADPAKADPAKADPAKADPAKSDPPKSDPPKSDPAKSDPPANNSGGSNNHVDVGQFSQLGYAWTMNPSLLPSYRQSKTTLIYNWGVSGPDVEGFEFMPMLWGSSHVDEFIAATNKKTPKICLGPNEPELVNDSGLSSGMSVDEVVSAYWKALAPLQKKGVKILTPAVTSGDKGFNWMKDFMAACQGCHFDGQALHWYDTTAEKAIAHFNRHHDQFKLPIYNTEIAFNNFNNGPQLSLSDAKREMGIFNNWVKGEGSAFMKVVMYFGFQEDMVNVSPTLQLINTGNDLPNDLGWSVINSLKQ